MLLFRVIPSFTLSNFKGLLAVMQCHLMMVIVKASSATVFVCCSLERYTTIFCYTIAG